MNFTGEWMSWGGRFHWFDHVDSIASKPVPRWPYRASYRSQVRDARKRRAKGRKP